MPCRLALSVLALVGCAAPIEPREPAGWADEVALPRPVDLDPDPHVLEIELVARETTARFVPAGPTTLAGYDGSIPGPLLELAVGDRLVVHFRNELSEPTTIHWHGVRVPNAMDGVPDHTQPAVSPGGRFTYDFVVPDEGLYWYHPHLRSAAQVAAGLYGAIVVRAADEPEVDEAVLVLSDVGVDGATGALLPPDLGGDLATLFGREGNVILVNGRVRPTIRARSGVPMRLRLVNAAISRYFALDLSGTTFTVVGGDAGFFARSREVATLLLVPGQRLDVLLAPHGPAGRVLPLRWLPFDRGYGTTEFREPEDILRVVLERGPSDPVPLPAAPPRAFTPIDGTGATEVDLELTRNDVGGTLALGIDGVPSWAAPPIPARIGEVQRWTIRNSIEWAHPFHLHGFFFQPLDPGGRPTGVWADTIDVAHTDGVRSFLVRFDERPGMWMFHCHILDHADAGMMGMVDLVE